MNKYNFDSYCGLYCGACDIHLAFRTGYKSRLASFWSAPLLRKFLTGLGAAYNERDLFERKCYGCKSGTLFVNCKACGIRACAVSRKIEHCIDCADYPCPQFHDRKRIEVLLPHLKVSHLNMQAIRKAGIREWLEDQEKQWRCPQCGTSYAWYSSRCMQCGGDLSRRAFRFSFLQSLFLKIGIRLMAAKMK